MINKLSWRFLEWAEREENREIVCALWGGIIGLTLGLCVGVLLPVS